MAAGCQGCRDGTGFETPFTMAFQPIVDLSTGAVFAHEALVRGTEGQGAWSILDQVETANRYAFDQQCRIKAIELAAALKLAESGARLSINFLPNAVYEPRACIRLTLATAMRTGFPTNRIIFEFTEDERVDAAHLLSILRAYRDMGFMTAIDDFGAGYAGLSLLAQFRPDVVKIDMSLIRDIDRDPAKRIIVKTMLGMLNDLEVATVCEGVETAGELNVLTDLGVNLIQGYVLAKPAFEALALPTLPHPHRSAA